jgi:D-alanyl-D-alanine carboxypeptidase
MFRATAARMRAFTAARRRTGEVRLDAPKEASRLPWRSPARQGGEPFQATRGICRRMSKGAEEHTMERVAVQKRTMIGKAARCAGLCGVLALVGLVAAAAPASAARPASPAPKLQQAMEELVAAGVPGVVVLIREGDRTIRLSSGYGNLATKAPLRPTDRFRIASLTKTFVATVVLQLVEEGKLSLEDTVERWLPGVVPNGENITVRELLAHKSGLFDYSQDPRVLKPYLSGNLSYYWAPRRLVQIAVSHRPLFAPGTAVSYSSTGYVLLGLIVRSATGRDCADGSFFEVEDAYRA